MSKILLVVKFSDNTDNKPFRGGKTVDNSLRNFKNFLTKCLGYWEFAIMYENGSVLHYFYHTKGVETLTKEEYTKELQSDKINLYIVPTYAHKMATGNHSAKTVIDATLEDIPGLYNETVQKIIAYQNNQVIATYENGKYL